MAWPAEVQEVTGSNSVQSVSAPFTFLSSLPFLPWRTTGSKLFCVQYKLMCPQEVPTNLTFITIGADYTECVKRIWFNVKFIIVALMMEDVICTEMSVSIYHGAIPQKTASFILVAVCTCNLAWCKIMNIACMCLFVLLLQTSRVLWLIQILFLYSKLPGTEFVSGNHLSSAQNYTWITLHETFHSWL